ncbi:Uncharacterised protein [Klebsiella quasipneumoniae]|nr:Uncharacterised protein [Klebsiella quasipneumoniae]VAP86959.1 Uncharacterised protein [Klebsiella quasipneumoniae]VAP88494.1 Uncharacterised protein [Klebsiella quasipneumoniae]
MSKPDWEAIETAYRAGVMSLRSRQVTQGKIETNFCCLISKLLSPYIISGWINTYGRYTIW